MSGPRGRGGRDEESGIVIVTCRVEWEELALPVVLRCVCVGDEFELDSLWLSGVYAASVQVSVPCD